MHIRHLRAVFDKLLPASLLPALAAGCGPDLSLYEPPACEGGQLSLAGLRPAMPVDYAEMRRVISNGDPMAVESVVARTGTACQTAGDRASCEADLAMLRSSGAVLKTCLDFCTSYYLAVTRGDEVRAIDSDAAWRAFLGPIDTAQEAALLTWSQDYRISCTDRARGGVRAVPGGYEVIGTKGITCGPGTALRRYVVFVDADGRLSERSEEVLERGDPNCVIGRRPAGLRARRARRRGGGALGRYLGEAAGLEAASVAAFLALRAELAQHGAPGSLLAQALVAAHDEVRHARVTAWLARRHGGVAARPAVAPRRARPLLEIAVENEVEGCVRETFGALIGRYQAARAGDPAIAAVMADIAEDEARHAALSWQVADFLAGRLPARALSRVREARRGAVAALRAELARDPAPELRRIAGLPGAEESLHLIDQMDRALWA